MPIGYDNVSMLCFFSVKNFKGFKDTISLDLTASNYEFNHECVQDGYAHKALIYGYNGVGKSNFGLAIMDIIINLTDKEKDLLMDDNYLNAETENKIVEFKYKFKFNNTIIDYYYGKTSPQILVYEHLRINGKTVISYDRIKNEPLTINLAGTETLNKDIDKISFSVLKYIKSNAVFAITPETEGLVSFFDFVDRMLFFRTLDDRKYVGYEIGRHQIFDEIINKNHFYNFVDFLNDADVSSNITYQKVGNQYKVFFSYETEQKRETMIEFVPNCSAGMKALSSFFYWVQESLMNIQPPSFIFIDEFDAFYHERLAEFIVQEIKKIKNCQFILTTHDTGVMSNDIMRPDCLFLMHKGKIESVSAKASKLERELRSAHNIEKMYRAGVFDE